MLSQGLLYPSLRQGGMLRARQQLWVLYQPGPCPLGATLSFGIGIMIHSSSAWSSGGVFGGSLVVVSFRLGDISLVFLFFLLCS